MAKKPLIYFVTGEPSGDNLGMSLIRCLKKISHVRLAGVGGTQMEKAGDFQSLFPMTDLTLFGLSEILPHIPKLLWRMHQIKRDIQIKQPDVIVTIDSPGFNFHLMKKLKKVSIPKIHYTAPTVWAWAPGRAKKIAKLYSHLFTLYPFEPPYFENEGLPSTFVGHPITHQHNVHCLGRHKAREQLSLAEEHFPYICLLPGSRKSEVHLLLPILQKTVQELCQYYPKAHFLIPTFKIYQSDIQSVMSQTSAKYTLYLDDAQKPQVMQSADLAIAASGTVALQLAQAACPTVTIYKLKPLTGFFVKLLVQSPYASMVNILLKKEVVPEFLQENCTAENIVKAALDILKYPAIRDAQLEGFSQALQMLKNPNGEASEIAARTIIQQMKP